MATVFRPYKYSWLLSFCPYLHICVAVQDISSSFSSILTLTPLHRQYQSYFCKFFKFHWDYFRAKIRRKIQNWQSICGVETPIEDPNVPVCNNGIKLGHQEPCNDQLSFTNSSQECHRLTGQWLRRISPTASTHT